jgi:hypothetical protein
MGEGLDLGSIGGVAAGGGGAVPGFDPASLGLGGGGGLDLSALTNGGGGIASLINPGGDLSSLISGAGGLGQAFGQAGGVGGSSVPAAAFDPVLTPAGDPGAGGDVGNQLTGDQPAGSGGGGSSQGQQTPPPQSPMGMAMPQPFLDMQAAGPGAPAVNPFQVGGGGSQFGQPGGGNAGDFQGYPGMNGNLPQSPTTFSSMMEDPTGMGGVMPPQSAGFPTDFAGRFSGQPQGYPDAGGGVPQDTAFEQQQEDAMDPGGGGAPDGGDGGGAPPDDGGGVRPPPQTPAAAPPAGQPAAAGAGGGSGPGGGGGQGRPGDALESFLRGIFGGRKGGPGGIAGLLKPLLSKVLQSAFKLSPSMADMASQAITQGLLPGAGRGADGSGTGGTGANRQPSTTPTTPPGMAPTDAELQGGQGRPPPEDWPGGVINHPEGVNVPKVATPQEAAALPPGSLYTAPDGFTRRTDNAGVTRSLTPGGAVGAPPRRFGGTGIRSDTANTLAAGGMSDNATAGIMRNIQQESGFNPGSREADQPRFTGEAHYAHGLYQEGGENWNRFASWMQQKGLDPRTAWRDPQLQTQFLIDNLKRNYPRLWQAMNNAGSPAEAADLFLRGYLRPASQHLQQRSAGFRRGVPSVLQQLGIY